VNRRWFLAAGGATAVLTALSGCGSAGGLPASGGANNSTQGSAGEVLRSEA
jgi:hypothetical protein